MFNFNAEIKLKVNKYASDFVTPFIKSLKNVNCNHVITNLFVLIKASSTIANEESCQWQPDRSATLNQRE